MPYNESTKQSMYKWREQNKDYHNVWVRVRVRVSRTLGDRVTGVAPYVLNLFLLTPYTQSNPKVYCVLKI